jgi:hypothetical protein
MSEDITAKWSAANTLEKLIHSMMMLASQLILLLLRRTTLVLLCYLKIERDIEPLAEYMA